MRTFNKLALEPYKGSGKPEAQVSSGFATIKQRHSLVGLKLLADATVYFGTEPLELKKGSTVFFIEEQLHAAQWTKKLYEGDGIEGQFVLAEPAHMVLVK